MRIKTIQARTMVELFDAIRIQLGPLAVLISVRRVSLGDSQILEGTACGETTINADEVPMDERPGLLPPTAPAARPEQAGMPRGDERATMLASHSAADARISEPVRSPGSASADGTHALVLIGPPGSGKSTMAAKIAARVQSRTGKPVGLLSCEGANAASMRSLRGFAQQMRIPWARVRSASQLRELLLGWNRRGPLVMDTPSEPLDEHDASPLGWLRGENASVETHLVLDAGDAPSAIVRAMHEYAPASPRKVVLTRMDRGDHAARALAQVMAAGREVSFLGTGERVPEDVACPSSRKLFEMLV